MQPSTTSTSADYIVVGGGLSGCVVASILSRNSKSVILIEAGSDPTGRPEIAVPLGGFALLGSDLDWAYQSAPEAELKNRKFTMHAGKGLGGGTVINFGGWIRGSAGDYDLWAETVDDERWSFKCLLAYMKRVETFEGGPQSKDVLRGVEGPMHVTSISSNDTRKYPLRKLLLGAWKGIGQRVRDEQDGDSGGINEWQENSREGNRQCAHFAYPLDGVDIKINTTVQRVLFEGTIGVASGVKTIDGHVFSARKEVILAAGAYRSPQILMLSGIGPTETLEKHGIKVLHHSPYVGQNFYDHCCNYMAFRLKDPKRKLALAASGGPHGLTDPALFSGLPIDWVINIPFSASDISKYSGDDKASNGNPDKYAQLLAQDRRNLIETFTGYFAAGFPGIPTDGSHVVTSTMLSLPSSRGSVSISSARASDTPVVNTNYISTELDRKVLTEGTRSCLRALLAADSTKDYFDSEVPISWPGCPKMEPLTPESTDEEILDRIRAVVDQGYHPGGTCMMGKSEDSSGSVVDVEGRVHGVKGLRVVDASIVPVPLGGHPQASLYPMAEQLAEMILGRS